MVNFFNRIGRLRPLPRRVSLNATGVKAYRAFNADIREQQRTALPLRGAASPLSPQAASLVFRGIGECLHRALHQRLTGLHLVSQALVFPAFSILVHEITRSDHFASEV